METYNAIGIMSGTSLDGLDIAYCSFTFTNNKWDYRLIDTQTIDYPKELFTKLEQCIYFQKEEIIHLDIELGHFIGKNVKHFIDKHKIKPILVASHGHTVLHQPNKGITLQIGNGKIIKQYINTIVINDFRSLDVKLGGQGAPLVPIGDRLLFSKYDYCLNLGGIANISYEINNERKAFDICSCNLILNYLSQKVGLKYDNEGKMAQNGTLNEELYNKLLQNPYYLKKGAKSLGKEDVWNFDILILNDFNCPIEDKLRTMTELIAYQISSIISNGNILITGGGAYNQFLIQRISQLSNTTNIEVPSANIIEFKEAMIFAFLGTLKYLGKINVLSSVTGASEDSSSGVIH